MRDFILRLRYTLAVLASGIRSAYLQGRYGNYQDALYTLYHFVVNEIKWTWKCDMDKYYCCSGYGFYSGGCGCCGFTNRDIMENYIR